MGIGDRELHSAQASPGQLAQEFCPDWLSLGCADLHPKHLASTVGVHTHGDDDGNGDDAAAATNLEVGGIDPQIGPFPFDGSVEEGLHLVIDLFAQPRHLALGDARHAHRLDEIID